MVEMHRGKPKLAQRTFHTRVQKYQDRWCVWESDIPGLFLETDDLREMRDSIEDIAPELIVSNVKIDERELAETTILVSIRDQEGPTKPRRSKPRIFIEQLIAA